MPRGQSSREGFSLGDDDSGVNVVVGERIGCQRPPDGHYWVPPYTNDLGDKAMWFLNAIGFKLDEWQERVLRDWLHTDDYGRWAAEEACLLVPRQNGKTAIIEARELVGLYIIGEKLCLHTSVLFSSARESFYRNKAIIENFAPLRRITKFREGNDNLGITIKNVPEARQQGIVGGRVVYMARGTANARGWSADVIVLDEGYALTDDIMAGIDYATSARRNPFVIIASSTGLEESDTLLNIRERGLAHDPDMVFHEWCATPPDEDTPVDLDNIEKWYEANPAAGIRISFKRMAKERKRHSDRAFGRERLGLWADNAFRAVISPTVWRNLCGCNGRIHDDHKMPGDVVGEFNQIVGAPVVAIDSDPLGENTTIALAGWDAFGRVQVEVLSSGRGVSWATDYVDNLFNATSNPSPQAVVVQTGATAGRLLPELEALGANVIAFGVRDVCDACKHFYDRAMDSTLVHLGDISVASALNGATKVHLGRMGGTKEEPEYRAWYWGRRDTTINITGLCATTWAAWGLARVWAEEQANKEDWVDKPRGGGLW